VSRNFSADSFASGMLSLGSRLSKPKLQLLIHRTGAPVANPIFKSIVSSFVLFGDKNKKSTLVELYFVVI
jgi:hypothetical protein